MQSYFIKPAIFSCVLVIVFLLISIFLFLAKRKIRAKDALIYSIFCLFNLVLMYFNKLTWVVFSLSAMSLLMLLTAVGMLLLKAAPRLYKIARVKEVDVSSQKYDDDIILYFVMFCINVSIVISIFL